MYFLYSLGGVTFNKCWITLSILNCYSPNFLGFILMKNALNNQVGMLGDMFLWLVANLKQGVIYFIKQALPPKHFSRECTFQYETPCSMQAFYLFKFFKQGLCIFSQKLSNENKQPLYKIQKCQTDLFNHVLLIKQNECNPT